MPVQQHGLMDAGFSGACSAILAKPLFLRYSSTRPEWKWLPGRVLNVDLKRALECFPDEYLAQSRDQDSPCRGETSKFIREADNGVAGFFNLLLPALCTWLTLPKKAIVACE